MLAQQITFYVVLRIHEPFWAALSKLQLGRQIRLPLASQILLVFESNSSSEIITHLFY